MIESGALGKKVFFLYPPPVLGEVTEELAKHEFEIYVVRDHERLRRFLASSPESILFINLDEGLDEPGWEAYIRSLRSQSASLGLGILTLNDRSPEIKEKYLLELQASCGFVVLKIGAAKTAEILIKALEANEAKGRRKFVRALCPPGAGQCVGEWEGGKLRAEVTDLSSAGMALRFEDGQNFRVGTVLRELGVSIKGVRLLVSGFVAAKRGEGEEGAVHVLMFEPGSIDEQKRERLQSLVHKLNQANMDRLLETA